MSKVEVYHYMRVLLMSIGIILAFQNISFCQYRLNIIPVDKDTAFVKNNLALETNFKTRSVCATYINKLPDLLQKKGYPTASVDSMHTDSLSATVLLYIGEQLRWGRINLDSVDKRLAEAITLDKKFFDQHPVNFEQFQSIQKKMLDYLENNGYPFARIELDSIQIENGSMQGIVKVNKGPLYKIDSIRNYGTARISNNFLQHYLGIRNGSIYRKNRLQEVSKKISELPYVQEKQTWDLSLLGTGSVLNMYLLPKKSSQINVLVGLLPANQQLASNKLLVTGEAIVNLRNALGNGETIGLNWQQIQVKSPRLNILFQQPYLFHSPFGVNFNFDLFKKDSSYVNISILLGVQYAVSSNRSGSIFIQRQTTNLLTVDTFFVKNNHRLPQEADLSSVNVGISYELHNTNYRFNPRKGNELKVNASVGTKKISKNNVILKLQDNFDPSFDFNSLYDTIKLSSYQFRINAEAAHYFSLSRTSTLKTSVSGGWFESPVIFRNELFQIGGYKLLRGFDEESIFASRYAVGTAEYRYFLGLNSFLFAFMDFGWARNSSQSNTFIGTGLGMAFETKAGIFNLSYAAGKRDDVKFSLRQSKIHLGYINYF